MFKPWLALSLVANEITITHLHTRSVAPRRTALSHTSTSSLSRFGYVHHEPEDDGRRAVLGKINELAEAGTGGNAERTLISYNSSRF